jgi:hypothetical protein
LFELNDCNMLHSAQWAELEFLRLFSIPERDRGSDSAGRRGLTKSGSVRSSVFMDKFIKIFLIPVYLVLLLSAAGCERELNLGFRISETDDSDETVKSSSDVSTSLDSETEDDSESNTESDRSHSDRN